MFIFLKRALKDEFKSVWILIFDRELGILLRNECFGKKVADGYIMKFSGKKSKKIF